MAKKAKRYRVWFHDPILNTWRVIAPSVTITDVKKLTDMIMYDCKKEEVEDDTE